MTPLEEAEGSVTHAHDVRWMISRRSDLSDDSPGSSNAVEIDSIHHHLFQESIESDVNRWSGSVESVTAESTGYCREVTSPEAEEQEHSATVTPSVLKNSANEEGVTAIVPDGLAQWKSVGGVTEWDCVTSASEENPRG